MVERLHQALTTHKLCFFSLSLICNTAVFADELFDVKRKGYEQYQDVYVQGRVIEKASDGGKYLDERFAIVDRVLSRYSRPFTLLDVGAAQGYFCFRAAERYSRSEFVMLEGSNDFYPLSSSQLDSICRLNKHLKNVVWLNRPIVMDEISKLSRMEHFDLLLLLNILHWFPENWEVLLENCIHMSDVTIVEVPPSEDGTTLPQKEFRKALHADLSKIATQIVKGVPAQTKHTTFYILENSSVDYNTCPGSLGISQNTYQTFRGTFKEGEF